MDFPLALLEDELKNEDSEVRFNAVKRIRSFALALGPERARKELIPVLNAATEEDDEILAVIAEETGNIIDCVGGSAHAVCLLEPLLESLCGIEEPCVREKALESTKKVLSIISEDDLSATAMPMVNRLANGSWFTSRVSVCALLPLVYEKSHVAANRAKLRGWAHFPVCSDGFRRLFIALARDATPMVRRAAARAILDLVRVCEPKHANAEVLPLLKELTDEFQENHVQLIACENAMQISEFLPVELNEEHIIPLFHRYHCAQRSWRLREACAKYLHVLCNAVGDELTQTELLGPYKSLLTDSMTEVKAAAVTPDNMITMCKLSGPELFVGHVVLLMRDLVKDLDPMVRANLAWCCVMLGDVLDTKRLRERILPLISTLLQDTETVVRAKAVDNLERLIKNLPPPAIVDTLLPLLHATAQDANWRIRRATAKLLLPLAERLGVELFVENVLPLFKIAMDDSANAIRISVCASMLSLYKHFGEEWIVAHIIPALRHIFSKATFQGRITVEKAVLALSGADDATELLTGELQSLVMMGLADTVPNVRLVASQAAKVLAGILPSSAVSGELR